MKTFQALKLAISMALFLLSSSTWSQIVNLNKSEGCIVTETKEKATYTESGQTEAQPILVGTVIPQDATVQIGKKSALTLACDDRSLLVNRKGVHKAADLAKEVQQNGETSLFAKMAVAAKGYGETPPDTTKPKPIKGWGDKDSIIFKLPIGGKIPLQPTTFRWIPLKNGSIYKVVIYQSSKDAPILTAQTSTASFTFDPSQLAINTGQTYHAQVMLANDSKVTSKVVNFSIVSSSAVESAMASLTKDKGFLSGNAAQKALMQAAEFENQELFTLANEKYLMALKLDANNSMAKRMYVAFLDKVSK